MSGKTIFRLRQETFRKACLKYWRYVFNDHAVLFFTFLLGALAYTTSKDPQLLRTIVKLLAYLGAIVSFLFAVGPSVPLYIEEADGYWLRTNYQFFEEYLSQAFLSASYLALGKWLICLLVVLGTKVWPLAYGLLFSLVTLVILVGKLMTLKKKSSWMIQRDFRQSYQKEMRRQARWWLFFSQFTRVKERRLGQVKRRAYLDFLMHWGQKQMRTVHGGRQLALALRSSEYLTSWIWLTVLGLLLSIGNLPPLFLLAIQAIFLLMTTLQWGSLRQFETHTFLERVQRASKAEKEHDFHHIIAWVILLQAGIFGIVSKVTHWETLPSFGIVVFLLFAFSLYGLSAYRERKARRD